MNKLIIFTLFICYQSIKAITEDQTNLVLVEVGLRHGARTVLLNFPHDPNQAVWDEYGIGQLVPIGMKQAQDYGAFIKNKYSNFLNFSYSQARVYARSTDVDRTMQSATTFLSAIFQPAKDQLWTSVQGQSSWFPIPIHTNNVTIDPIMHSEAPCARKDQLKGEMRQTPEYIKAQNENQAFFNNMTALSGLYFDLYNITRLGDKYYVQTGMNLPNEQYLLDNLDKLLYLTDLSYNIDYMTAEMARFVSGGLLNNIVDNMKSKISGSKNLFYAYGIHDSNIVALQKLLNTTTKFKQPNYVSSFVFELRNDTKGAYYVQVLYKDQKPSEPIVLTPVAINGCDVICPFDKFVSLVKDNLVSDYSTICKAKPTNFIETIAYYFDYFLSMFRSS